jgi:hypothetical protein
VQRLIEDALQSIHRPRHWIYLPLVLQRRNIQDPCINCFELHSEPRVIWTLCKP